MDPEKIGFGCNKDKEKKGQIQYRAVTITTNERGKGVWIQR
jgi:hypothetical protein